MRLSVRNPKPFWAEPFKVAVTIEQSAGTTSSVDEDSHTFRRETDAENAETYIVDFEIIHGDQDEDYTAVYSSSDTDVCIVNSAGLITVVSSGNATITATVSDSAGNEAVSSVFVTVSISDGVTVDYVRPKVGTLGANLSDTLGALVTASAEAARFSAKDYSTKKFTRNENFFLKDIAGLSAVSVWNSRGGNTRGATAISPRHVIFAPHFPLKAGDTVCFCPNASGEQDGVIRTISQVKNHPLYKGSSKNYGYDFAIGLLDSDLPALIDFVPIAPVEMLDYFGQFTVGRVGMTFFNQDAEARTGMGLSYGDFVYGGEIISLGSVATLQGEMLEIGVTKSLAEITSTSDIVALDPVTGADFLRLHKKVRTYDSGQPNFWLSSNDGLVLSHLHTFPNSGYAVNKEISALNQLIADVDALAGISTGYTLTEADFSAFPTYT